METKIYLNLVTDEDEKRVVYAEADRDFVDVLLSFLVRPVGTAVRLAGDKTKLGSMDSLYKSLDSLDAKHFSTEACKKMLLHPVNADHTRCNNLAVPLDDSSLPYNMCPDWYDKSGKHHFFSCIEGTKCRCGKVMVPNAFPWYKDNSPSNVGVFLKGMNKYLITDDLRVSVIGTPNVNELSKEVVDKVHRLTEKKVQVGRQEVLDLLKHALISKTALTDTFIGGKSMETSWKSLEVAFLQKISNGTKGKKLTMDLVVNKSNGKFLYAQGKEDVVNFFFSFLTFPLGLLSDIYNGSSSIGCIDELRGSARLLSDKEQLRTDEHFEFLYEPKIAAHHTFKNQVLNIKEGHFSKVTVIVCPGTILHAINPKSPSFTTKKGGGFVKGPVTFMISDNLEIKPASVSKGLGVFRKFDNIKVIPVAIGEIEALKLLHASLTSSTPLSSVLFDEVSAKKAKKGRLPLLQRIRQSIKAWKKERSL